MKYIEAPEKINLNSYHWSHQCTLFLAGSITNAKNWQSNVIESLKEIENLIVFNPRRKQFDINDPSQSDIQIVWEYNYLRSSKIVSFYFSEETFAPITLFELGSRLEAVEKTNQIVIVYCEENYKRKYDVQFQMKLAIDQLSKKNGTFFFGTPPIYCNTFEEFLNTLKYKIEEHNTNAVNYRI